MFSLSMEGRVCDESCNNKASGWDGGDCNQLCPFFSEDDEKINSDDSAYDCSNNLLFNDECDMSCNISSCVYDFYQCVEIDTNNTCDESYNVNDTCYNDWVDDLWRDKNCNVTECNMDG